MLSEEFTSNETDLIEQLGKSERDESPRSHHEMILKRCPHQSQTPLVLDGDSGAPLLYKKPESDSLFVIGVITCSDHH